jgi:polyphosphate kinase 2 (PPK2 family)
VLIVLQALDTGGKDGVINHVLGAMNPLGCRVASLKKPGPEAAAHNYLWRVSILLPEKGEVVIFNRSHYEDVAIRAEQAIVLTWFAASGMVAIWGWIRYFRKLRLPKPAELNSPR